MNNSDMAINNSNIAIQDEFRSILEENKWSTHIDGIDKIFETWEINKAPLMNILRKHPNWNEDKKMVKFSTDYHREVDTYAIREFFHWVLWDVIVRSDLCVLAKQNIDAAIDAAGLLNHIIDDLSNYSSPSISLELAEKLNAFDEKLRIREGQKTTRAVNKFLISLGIDKHPDYNRRFAMYADALNPLTINRHTCISVNPIDYLLMSNGNSWSSCHSIILEDGDYGCYCTGTMSYLLDSSSFIFYTVSADYNGSMIEQEPKINRQVFCYQNDKLLQSRLYPTNNDYGAENTYTEIRNVVQKVIADCLEIPNRWIKKTYEVSRELIDTDDDSTHYRDYHHFSTCNVSVLRESENSGLIYVGHPAICIECGYQHSDERNLSCCSDIPSSPYCSSCDCYIDEFDSIYNIDGYIYCGDCAGHCVSCDNDKFTEDMQYIDSVEGYVCDDCLDNYFYYCDICGEYYEEDIDRVVTEHEDIYACINCYEENFACCRECATDFRTDKTALDGDFELCNTCYTKAKESEEVEEDAYDEQQAQTV